MKNQTHAAIATAAFILALLLSSRALIQSPVGLTLSLVSLVVVVLLWWQPRPSPVLLAISLSLTLFCWGHNSPAVRFLGSREATFTEGGRQITLFYRTTTLGETTYYFHAYTPNGLFYTDLGESRAMIQAADRTGNEDPVQVYQNQPLE
ncbi:hypothetical protein [Lacticaseibacillus daqingensis]|uniref:hypothetical protein n=1 Tax=Lacticaseibacillus daqingensis TaxID=2486014 RepID=UPI000F783387|nr:hypothetical protein [Lacticaseibacillus daqingensis]